MEREEMLKKVPIFAGLDRRHLKQLSKLMVPRAFKTGDVIFKENDQAAGFFVISSGRMLTSISWRACNARQAGSTASRPQTASEKSQNGFCAIKFGPALDIA